MSNTHLNAAKSAPVSTPTAKLVLLLLADSASEKGLAWPSVSTLMEWSGCGRRSVQRALRELANDGFIRTQNAHPGQSVIYEILVDHCSKGGATVAQEGRHSGTGATVAHAPNTTLGGATVARGGAKNDQKGRHSGALSQRTPKNPNRTIGGEDPNHGNSNHGNSSEPLGDALSDRIAKCNPAWRRAWSYEEQSSIALNRQFWISLGEEDWELLRAWFSIRERENEQLYRVQKLSRFLADPGSELDKARAMRDRDRRRMDAAMAPKRKRQERPAEEPEDEPIDPTPPEEAKKALGALRRGIMGGFR